MNVRDFVVDRFEKFLAPSACLFFETLFKVLPIQLGRTHQRVTLIQKNGDRIFLDPGEQFTVLGYSKPRGEERVIILMTSKGIGCCLLLKGLI